MNPELNAIMIYARDMEETARFYQRYFGLASIGKVEGLIELGSAKGGLIILIHQAAKSLKLGQVAVKLVFAVEDVEAFKRKSAKRGLGFGSIHRAHGYLFANAKDPDKNSIQISSRAFRGGGPNQTMRPTAGRRPAKISMTQPLHPAATHAFASGGSSYSR
ncbi:MAG TPA: VOC family protein [Rhizomicrobium sp.]|jgi:predicted enzyme related to lactoylglutathione lyase|nr:VOC family protein [Rhizomicrobium sp.]